MSLALAVAVPTFWGGGFSGASQGVLVALAGGVLLVSTAVDGPDFTVGARTPIVATLIALAVLGFASAAWTIGSPSVAERTGLVVGGYAVFLLAGRSLGHRVGPQPIAIGIGVLAVAQALLGLDAVAMHALPDAERLGRVWRPGGSFEYQPALALLEVGALPVLALAITRARSTVAGAAAAAATLAGAAIGLADNRSAFVLAAVTLIALAWLARSDRRACAAVAMTTTLVIAGGVAAPLLLGYSVRPRAPGAGVAGLAALVAVAVVCGCALTVSQIALRRGSWRGLAAALSAALLLAVAIVAVGGYSEGHADANRGVRAVAAPRPAQTDLLHGRTHEWLAALETWADRPLIGAGSGAYYVASISHQTIARSLFAHDLPLESAAELGVPGLLLVIALYVSSGLLVWRTRRTAEWPLLAPFAIAFLISNLVDWTWHLTGLTAIWAAATGGLLALSRPDQRRSDDGDVSGLTR